MRGYVFSCVALFIGLAGLGCSGGAPAEREEPTGSSTNGGSGGAPSTSAAIGVTGGAITGNLTSGGPPDPCEAEDAPDNCKLMPSGPACGDGEINLDPPEPCDDGNSLPGDGCSGTWTWSKEQQLAALRDKPRPPRVEGPPPEPNPDFDFSERPPEKT